MPKTEKVYPEWVQKHRTKGTTVKKKGDSYYLYKRTSRRVPGKKYPQPVDTYIGIITPEGVVETNRKKLELSDIEVWEYGYTKTLVSLCPQGWKDSIGDEWKDVLKCLIIRKSPGSYLVREGEAKRPEDFHCSFSAQAGMLSRRIFNEYKIDLKDLEPLKGIYLVCIGKQEAVSRISDENMELLRRIGVELEN